MSQQRVRHNDWGTLILPAFDEWEPTKSVSVVIPAYDCADTLPYVLAGLAAQTYPAHLLEVLVVDDSPSPITLPELRPERTRLLRTASGWGRAAACHTGAEAADGDILHWLDSDMLAEADEVARQARWHDLLDHAVVLGQKWFVDPAPLSGVSPEQVREIVARGEVGTLFAGQERLPHDWVESLYGQSEDLRLSGPRAHRAHVGASASLLRSLYFEAGGMDTSLRLGEDSELGYRLSECGAVFIPDRQAVSWHLGNTQVMRRQDDVNDYNLPHLAHRIPDGRVKRASQGRTYLVPYAEVVIDTAGLLDAPASHRHFIGTVEAVLASTVPDLIVTLIGPWSTLTDERVRVLDEPLRSLRAAHDMFTPDPRVHFVESLPPGRSPAMVRLTLTSTEYAPDPGTLNRLIRDLELTHHGVRSALLPDGLVARLERTAAVSRARRVAEPGESLDDVINELFGSWWVEGAELGFVPTVETYVRRLPGRAGPPQDPVEVARGRKPASAPAAPDVVVDDPEPTVLRRVRSLAGRVLRRAGLGRTGSGRTGSGR